MFERYPKESVKALFVARASALAAGAACIDAEHLLTGALEAWPHAGVARETIAQQLGLTVPAGLDQVTEPDIQFSPLVKRLLQISMAQADRLGHHRIRPEHLLLALLEERDSRPAAVLRLAGIQSDTLVESAARAARIDDSALAYQARQVVRVRLPDRESMIERRVTSVPFWKRVVASPIDLLRRFVRGRSRGAR